jgi:hypothetical protein
MGIGLPSNGNVTPRGAGTLGSTSSPVPLVRHTLVGRVGGQLSYPD